MSIAAEVVLGVVVLGLLIYRQLMSRPVNASGMRIVVIIAVVGLVEAFQYLQKYHAGGVTYAALGGSLVLAAGFGALRASTVRIWLQGGQPWSKGNWLTGVLWVVAFAAHLGYDALVAPAHGNGGVGAATVVLYLAVSLGIQRAIVQQRANRLQPGGAPFTGTSAGTFG